MRRTYSAIAASSFPCLSSLSACFNVASRSIATEIPGGGNALLLNDRIKQRGRPERAAVQRRVTVLRNSREMFRGGIALVPVIAVARIGGMVCAHLTIARHLGEDRGRRDGRAAPIAVQHAALRHHQLRNCLLYTSPSPRDS